MTGRYPGVVGWKKAGTKARGRGQQRPEMRRRNRFSPRYIRVIRCAGVRRRALFAAWTWKTADVAGSGTRHTGRDCMKAVVYQEPFEVTVEPPTTFG
ncbi:MAG: hypothetical protein WKF95_18600, partial [Rubrobacter sp.]